MYILEQVAFVTFSWLLSEGEVLNNVVVQVWVMGYNEGREITLCF